ncbi:hypothetical protein [Streptomyces collinus]|uniref:Uncharacterized protein n=1 Tax=Streptomyces collinus (strain DSM 40733 / Tue 365) TaxID=1214242 RepID=S5V8S5_STRC3|nr:hypothetical protein [Streptomyces collinus]AGS73951.1 hypothetical protein B446_35963 [Streptomyces collinus Tu 365]
MTQNGEIQTTPGPAPDGPKAWFELSARLGDIGQGVKQLVTDGRQARALPIQAVLTKGGDVPASGTVLLDFGAPAMGRRWTVKTLAVAPAAGLSGTLAGSANWYVGNPATYGPGEWAAPSMTTLPAFQGLGADQLWVTPTNRLFCVITGGTAGQSALARATILEYPLYSGHATIEL